jgi:predicted metal-binding membrane protein
LQSGYFKINTVFGFNAPQIAEIEAMDKARPDPLPLQRNIIMVSLLALAAASWAVLIWHDHTTMMASPATGMRVALFFAIVGVMMVAMMFPSAAPMILAFHRVAGMRQLNGAFVSTWVFVAAYLLVWWGFAFYAGALATFSGVSASARTAQIGSWRT